MHMQDTLDFENYLFKDREDAAKKLLEVIPKDIAKSEDWVLLCLSSGSVPIVEIIANELELGYDLLFVEPIFAPNNDECQVAMVSEKEEIVIHHNLIESFGITLDYIYGEAKRTYQNKLIDYQYFYRNSLALSDIKDRNVLLIDEGCETGFSTLCVLKTVLEEGIKKVSLATPVIAKDLYQNLEMKVDKIYTNNKIKDFIEVSYYYEELEKLKNKEVKKILEKSNWYIPYKGEK